MYLADDSLIRSLYDLKLLTKVIGAAERDISSWRWVNICEVVRPAHQHQQLGAAS